MGFADAIIVGGAGEHELLFFLAGFSFEPENAAGEADPDVAVGDGDRGFVIELPLGVEGHSLGAFDFAFRQIGGPEFGAIVGGEHGDTEGSDAENFVVAEPLGAHEGSTDFGFDFEGEFGARADEPIPDVAADERRGEGDGGDDEEVVAAAFGAHFLVNLAGESGDVDFAGFGLAFAVGGAEEPELLHAAMADGFAADGAFGGGNFVGMFGAAHDALFEGRRRGGGDGDGGRARGGRLGLDLHRRGGGEFFGDGEVGVGGGVLAANRAVDGDGHAAVDGFDVELELGRAVADDLYFHNGNGWEL